jgi:hypothetical protein
MTAEPGPPLATQLFSALMVDGEWSVRTPRGFAWWPHRAAQRVDVGEPFADGGAAGCRVVVETDVLMLDADTALPELETALSGLMRYPPMAAFRVDEETYRVTLVSALFVPDAFAPFFVPRLAVAAILQAAYAELGTEALARETGGRPAWSGHPSGGARPEPDGLLRLVAERIVPAGDALSRWDDPGELLAAADDLSAQGARARALPGGLNARIPFLPGAEDPLAPAASCLLQVRTREAHPELGHGVFLRLFLPGGEALLGGRTAASVSMDLNDEEIADDRFTGQGLGSWTAESSEPETELPVGPGPPRLCHVTFLPNYVAVPGALRNAVADAGKRAGWVAHLFAHRHGVS